ncbi:MAG: hypothetical protein GC205_05425 [Bacteroidetes bacterium]|nr:hypothetical protein [Bacteroidota bacterium]
MKQIATTLLFAALACGISAQNPNVTLHLNHLLGEVPFALNQASTHDGQPFNVKRLEYYLAEIEIVHDGGQVTSLPDTWFLVDASKDIVLSLGEMAVESIEGVRFGVGVEEDANHLDPASYPGGHPLAYQFPSMHWGWTSGYRFVAIEGFAGEALTTLWEVHALGDANYHTVSVSGPAVADGDDWIYYLNADYTQALVGLDLTLGLLEHGETGYAATLLDNMSSSVFTRAEGPLVGSAVDQAASLPADWTLFPNPVSAGSGRRAYVQLATPTQTGEQWFLYDQTGRELQRIAPLANFNQLELQLPAAGLYTLQRWHLGQALGQRRLMVTE